MKSLSEITLATGLFTNNYPSAGLSSFYTNRITTSHSSLTDMIVFETKGLMCVEVGSSHKQEREELVLKEKEKKRKSLD